MATLNDTPALTHRPSDGEAFGFDLTVTEVERLRRILHDECGVELTLEGAWARAIELLAFARLLLETQLPGRPFKTP